MTVVEVYVCGKKIDPPNNTSELSSGVTSLLIESVAQNTTGSVFVPEDGKGVEVSGSPTEKAILQWGVNVTWNEFRICQVRVFCYSCISIQL
ncbi:putative P-type Ca(2+) transporter [Helianthus anomalus]